MKSKRINHTTVREESHVGARRLEVLQPQLPQITDRPPHPRPIAHQDV